MVLGDEPAVRRQAATALGRIGESNAIAALLSALAREQGLDRTEEHAIIYALIEIGDLQATAKGLSAESPATIRGALIALDQMDTGRLSAQQAAAFLDVDDTPLRNTAADIICQHADTAPQVASQIRSWLSPGRPGSVKRETLSELASVFAADPQVAAAMGYGLSSPQTSKQIRQALFSAIATQSALPLHPSWVQPIEGLLESDETGTLQLGLAVVSAIQTDHFQDRLTEISSDPSRSKLLRVAAFEAASGGDARLSEPAFALLTELIRGDSTTVEAARAAQLLGNASLTAEQLLTLAPFLTLAGPIQIRDLIRPFQRDRRPEVATAFLDAMQDARSLLTLPVPVFSDVVKRYPDALRDRANTLLDQVKAEQVRQVEQVDRLLPLLKTGDAANGRKIFFSRKSKCSTCHRVGTDGGRIGPDLTVIGANRAAHDLLESIVLPSATIVREYEPYSVVTNQGRVVSGLIVRDTTEAIHIQPQTGEPVIVPRDQVESVTPSTVSVMPNGMEKALTEKELADVVAYLKSLRSP